MTPDSAAPLAWGEVDGNGAWGWKTSDEALVRLEEGRHTLRFLGAAGRVNLDHCTMAAPAL